MEITILSQLLLFSQANYNLEVWNWTSQAWTQRIRAMWFYHFLVEKWNWMDFSYIFISIGFGALKNSIQFLSCLFWLLLYLGTRASGWWTVAAVMGTPSTGRQNCNWLNSGYTLLDLEFWQYLWSLRTSFKLFIFFFFFNSFRALSCRRTLYLFKTTEHTDF